MLGPEWGFRPLIDISDEQARDDLARASVMALSLRRPVRARHGPPAGPADARSTSARHDPRALPDPLARRGRPATTSRRSTPTGSRAAEHGMNASTFTARVVASTGADVAAALSGAVGALSGPLHGGAPSRVLQDARRGRARSATPSAWVKRRARPRRAPHGLRPPRLPRRGPAGPRAAPHRARARLDALRGRRGARAARRSPSCSARKPDRVLATNVEFWSAVVLDLAEVPPDLFTPMFTCARVAGWSAHILEQKREARLIRPTAKYVGARARPVAASEPALSTRRGALRRIAPGDARTGPAPGA